MKKIVCFYFILCMYAHLASLFFLVGAIAEKDAMHIGLRIWQNECSGTLKGLICWNAGEDFASLGIGHFIWYPEEKKGLFVETFPDLLQFLQEKGYCLPKWLKQADGCPWKTRADFLRASESSQIQQLRTILKDTIALQGEFLAQRFEQILPILLKSPSSKPATELEALIQKIQKEPLGFYVLLDYVNFKGAGIVETERYQNQGWGLLQVLEAMPSNPIDPLLEFKYAAEKILTMRVALSPPERRESRWLPGWLARVSTYSLASDGSPG